MSAYRTSATILAATILIAVTWTLPAGAQQAAAIAQGFNASGDSADFITGALVSTKSSATDSVELTSLQSAGRLVGVVSSNPLLTISEGNRQVRVVLSGKAEALVSDINGVVHAGDRVTASPVNGIGMRATADSQIVGIAQSDQPTGSKAIQRTIKDSAGKSHSIHIGLVPIQVGTAFYQAPGSNFLPPVVQRLANSIAGQQVGFIRVLLSGAVLATTIIGIFILVYTSSKASMVSIGRNPIAAKTIQRSLYQVILLAAIILAFGLLASYLLLKL